MTLGGTSALHAIAACIASKSERRPAYCDAASAIVNTIAVDAVISSALHHP